MSKSFTTITHDVAKALGSLRKDIPEMMRLSSDGQGGADSGCAISD